MPDPLSNEEQEKLHSILTECLSYPPPKEHVVTMSAVGKLYHLIVNRIEPKLDPSKHMKLPSRGTSLPLLSREEQLELHLVLEETLGYSPPQGHIITMEMLGRMLEKLSIWEHELDPSKHINLLSGDPTRHH